MINRVRIFRILFVFFLLVSVNIIPAAADFDFDSWQYSRSILLPSDSDNERYVIITPDVEVYRHSANELADIRIVQDGTQEDIPYVILIDSGETQIGSIAGSIRDLSHDLSGNSSFQIDVDSQATIHNQVEILIDDENFRREAMIEGSRDGQAWSILNQGHLVFDFTIKEITVCKRFHQNYYPTGTNTGHGQLMPLLV